MGFATLPDYKQAYRAIQMLKDEYLLDYINVENWVCTTKKWMRRSRALEGVFIAIINCVNTKKCVNKEKKLRFFLYYSFPTAVYFE